MKNNSKLSLWERYLTKEIGIEFKSCLYFFAILFFYCVYRMLQNSFDAEIIHMAEMIFTCYIIEYIQVYLFGNFDEGVFDFLYDTFGRVRFRHFIFTNDTAQLVCHLIVSLINLTT